MSTEPRIVVDGAECLTLFLAAHPELLDKEPKLKAIAEQVRSALEAKGLNPERLLKKDISEKDVKGVSGCDHNIVGCSVGCTSSCTSCYIKP